MPNSPLHDRKQASQNLNGVVVGTSLATHQLVGLAKLVRRNVFKQLIIKLVECNSSNKATGLATAHQFLCPRP
jgi:hypothetical protein